MKRSLEEVSETTVTETISLPFLPNELWVLIISVALERVAWGGNSSDPQTRHMGRFIDVCKAWHPLVMRAFKSLQVIDDSMLELIQKAPPTIAPPKEQIKMIAYGGIYDKPGAGGSREVIYTLPNLTSLLYRDRYHGSPQIQFRRLATSLCSLSMVRSSHASSYVFSALPQLTELDLSRISGDIVEHGFQMGPTLLQPLASSLRSLTLRFNTVVQSVDISELTNLTHLDIGHTPVQNWGGTASKRIHGLKSFTQLKSLCLDGTGLRDSESWTRSNVARYLKSVQCLVLVDKHDWSLPSFPRLM